MIRITAGRWKWEINQDGRLDSIWETDYWGFSRVRWKKWKAKIRDKQEKVWGYCIVPLTSPGCCIKKLRKKNHRGESKMAGVEVDEMVVQLENQMELSTMEQGIKLVSMALTNKVLNKWGVRNVLRSLWKDRAFSQDGGEHALRAKRTGKFSRGRGGWPLIAVRLP